MRFLNYLSKDNINYNFNCMDKRETHIFEHKMYVYEDATHIIINSICVVSIKNLI